jgi:hypothetical protein
MQMYTKSTPSPIILFVYDRTKEPDDIPRLVLRMSQKRNTYCILAGKSEGKSQ